MCGTVAAPVTAKAMQKKLAGPKVADARCEALDGASVTPRRAEMNGDAQSFGLPAPEGRNEGSVAAADAAGKEASPEAEGEAACTRQASGKADARGATQDHQAPQSLPGPVRAFCGTVAASVTAKAMQ